MCGRIEKRLNVGKQKKKNVIIIIIIIINCGVGVDRRVVGKKIKIKRIGRVCSRWNEGFKINNNNNNSFWYMF